MVTVTLPPYFPLSPHKLRIAATIFTFSAAAALLTGCSATQSTFDPADAASGLRGLALATRPTANFSSDPARPQRHARQPQLSGVHFSANQHRPVGSNL